MERKPLPGMVCSIPGFWHILGLMKVYGVSISILCAVFLAGCKTTEPKEQTHQTYQGASFILQYPDYVTVAPEQGDGYAVHYFRMGQSKAMLGIYEGQRPRLFSKNEHDLTVMRRNTTSRGDIERGDNIWGVDSNGMIWRESVWSCSRWIESETGKKYQLPSMLHLWYFGATEEEQVVFDALVDTIEMRR